MLDPTAPETHVYDSAVRRWVWTEEYTLRFLEPRDTAPVCAIPDAWITVSVNEAGL